MSGSSRYTRAISTDVAEIERRLRALQKDLEDIGARASTGVRERAGDLSDTVAAALGRWADRFRDNANSLGDQSAAFGKDAARFGSDTLDRLSEHTEARPIAMLAVAVGVGFLLGIASRSWK